MPAFVAKLLGYTSRLVTNRSYGIMCRHTAEIGLIKFECSQTITCRSKVRLARGVIQTRQGVSAHTQGAHSILGLRGRNVLKGSSSLKSNHIKLTHSVACKMVVTVLHKTATHNLGPFHSQYHGCQLMRIPSHFTLHNALVSYRGHLNNL